MIDLTPTITMGNPLAVVVSGPLNPLAVNVSAPVNPLAFNVVMAKCWISTPITVGYVLDDSFVLDESELQ